MSIFVLCFSNLFHQTPSTDYLQNIQTKSKPETHIAKKISKEERKALYLEEKEKYEFSKLPESGHMTLEEYQEKSVSKKSPRNENVPVYEFDQDSKMEYVPQPIYGLVKYNNPAGSPELHLGRSFEFDRKFICPGIVSPQKDFLVYPVVYYYADNQCVSSEMYLIKLDKKLPDVQRIMKANIVNRETTPILPTEKDLSEKFIYRTMTPIDFSSDGTLLIAKEKIGHTFDGIWQTKLWVYNFRTQTAEEYPQIRETIKYYWESQKHIMLDEKRWDIYPLGFSAKNPNMILVSAYGFTGKTPKFLGTWGIDLSGTKTTLISLTGVGESISMNGYKLIKTGVQNYNLTKKQEKDRKRKLKAKKRLQKKETRLKNKKLKQEYHERLKQIG